MPNKNVLIKPSSGMCNMRCSYCFYFDEIKNREVENYGFMSEEILEQIIKKTIEASDTECTIGYQGGEPTLRGLDFYQKSIEFQRKYNTRGITIHNTIQTNGYHISDKWLSFLKENQFLTGISLDGTAYTHDMYRKDADGKDTHSVVLDTVHRMKKAGVEYNILTVVTAQTAKKIGSIYEFYKSEGFQFLQFIPCLSPFGGENTRYPHTLTPKLYGQFMKSLFDLWYQDLLCGRIIHIQQFENFVTMLQGNLPALCGMSGVCSMQNVIEADGEVYPCDFYVLDQYKLGNLAEVSFDEIDERRRQIAFVEQSIEMPEACRICRYACVCRNGCRRNREPMIGGHYQKNMFCESYKDFFDYTGSRLKEIARAFS